MIIFPSMFLYGKNKKISFEDSCPNPRDFYSLSKYVCEKIIYFQCKQNKIRLVILRIFNICGNSQKKSYMIPRLFHEIIKGDKLNFYNFSRDYLHVDDINTAFLASMSYEKKNFDIFNIGSGKNISAKNLAKMIGKITKKK